MVQLHSKKFLDVEFASSRLQDPGPALLCWQLVGPRELPEPEFWKGRLCSRHRHVEFQPRYRSQGSGRSRILALN